jgi:hypothetical protein
MFGTTGKKSFSYTTSRSLKKDDSVPLKKRLKITSLSSMERKPNSRRMIYLVVLLLIITSFMLYHGFKAPSGDDIRIEENEIEKVNG